jgi:hypothetical protein
MQSGGTSTPTSRSNAAGTPFNPKYFFKASVTTVEKIA